VGRSCGCRSPDLYLCWQPRGCQDLGGAITNSTLEAIQAADAAATIYDDRGHKMLVCGDACYSDTRTPRLPRATTDLGLRRA
jgi:hypothetical protein